MNGRPFVTKAYSFAPFTLLVFFYFFTFYGSANICKLFFCSRPCYRKCRLKTCSFWHNVIEGEVSGVLYLVLKTDVYGEVMRWSREKFMLCLIQKVRRGIPCWIILYVLSCVLYILNLENPVKSQFLKSVRVELDFWFFFFFFINLNVLRRWRSRGFLLDKILFVFITNLYDCFWKGMRLDPAQNGILEWRVMCACMLYKWIILSFQKWRVQNLICCRFYKQVLMTQLSAYANHAKGFILHTLTRM